MWVIALVLAIIVMAVSLLYGKNIFGFGKATFQSELFQDKLRLCSVQGAQAELRPPSQRPLDSDKDGYPDSCDYCWGVSEGSGNDGKDLNGDGIPDDCEPPNKFVKSGGDLKESCNGASRCPKHDCYKDRKVCILTA